jgi:hypothetical protein
MNIHCNPLNIWKRRVGLQAIEITNIRFQSKKARQIKSGGLFLYN